MRLTDKLIESIKSLNKSLWIIIVPILLDLHKFFLYNKIFNTTYTPTSKLFLIKIGIVSIPPSIKFIFEDLPSYLFEYNNMKLSGVVNSFSLFNVSLLILVTLILSFINGGYLSIVNKLNKEKSSIKDFFILGNKVWFKFFIVDIISIIPIALFIMNRDFAFLSVIFAVIFLLLFYLKYSFVADNLSFIDHCKKSILVLSNNLKMTLKVIFFPSVIFSVLSIPIYLLLRLGTIGIIFDIIIFSYMGTVVNKVVLDVYKNISKNMIPSENEKKSTIDIRV
ncbi:hypothetical protein CLPU_3c01740 [Gottschalkia purinilytica]|uniref:Uncharacterized protein n=1 Tax=Gottschalkia purinilytica TaxID=1503 RepID=A0A0L0WD79_GOTPU|nr:hypothetical protein [Gottschalkia purinilytica]KNF09396.1 hypothetical protein CLPU_3c01740 [Gottschalkia purinilytica]